MNKTKEKTILKEQKVVQADFNRPEINLDLLAKLNNLLEGNILKKFIVPLTKRREVILQW